MAYREDMEQSTMTEKRGLAIGPAPAEPTISDVIDELERYISLLGETVQMTEKRLLPVLRRPHGPTQGSAGGDSDESPSSGLSLRLQRLTSELLKARDELAYTLDRIDL
jgi:hypothetical protein